MITPHLRPHPSGVRPRLSDGLAHPPGDVPDKKDLDEALDHLVERMGELGSALGAEATRALLVVIQGRDACGKDGTVRRVFGGLNPALTSVTSFKRPTPLELRHDYLWRVHQALPPRGMIGIFNRSHYEDVLAVRVHQLASEVVWKRRYEQINAWERMVTEEGTVILKFFLHVSKDEQRKRLEERLADPCKNWKFQVGDLSERALWDSYSAAYEEALERCSTTWAPWYVVPADKNRARDYLVAQVIVRALEEIDPEYPAADPAVLAYRNKIV